MKITDSIKRLYRLVTHHIGSGGDAHASVSTMLNGFMTPKQKADLINAQGQRIVMPKKTDVLTLPAGIYEIVNATNNPVGVNDQTLTEYRIYTSSDNLTRHIIATHSVNSRVFQRTVHYDGLPESGTGMWVTPAFKTLVWSGSSSSGVLTFEHPLSERGLAIEYATKYGSSGYVEHSGRQSYQSLTAINLPNDNSTLDVQELELLYSVANDYKSLKIDSNTIIQRSSTGEAARLADNDGIRIVAVFTL